MAGEDGEEVVVGYFISSHQPAPSQHYRLAHKRSHAMLPALPHQVRQQDLLVGVPESKVQHPNGVPDGEGFDFTLPSGSI